MQVETALARVWPRINSRASALPPAVFTAHSLEQMPLSVGRESCIYAIDIRVSACRRLSRLRVERLNATTQTPFPRPHYRLGSGMQIQLFKHVGEVVANRMGRKLEFVSNLPVVIPLRDTL